MRSGSVDINVPEREGCHGCKEGRQQQLGLLSSVCDYVHTIMGSDDVVKLSSCVLSWGSEALPCEINSAGYEGAILEAWHMV